MKYSKLLSELLGFRNPEDINGLPIPMVEKVIVKMIDLFNTLSLEELRANDKELICALSLLLDNKKSHNSYRNKLLACLYEKADSNKIADTEYMEKLLEAAKKTAEAEGSEEISAVHLAKAIAEDPSELLKNVLDIEVPADTVVEEDLSEELPIDDFFDEESEFYCFEDEFECDTEDELEEKKTADEVRNALESIVQDTKSLQNMLSSLVVGQDNAVRTVAEGYYRSQVLKLTEKKRKKPGAVFLFAGPPGVGKTYLAEMTAQAMNVLSSLDYANEIRFKRFDMSEYADKESNLEFCGSDKVYKGGGRGNVTGFVEDNPRSVLLFDEVEKAHPVVINLFLQILDGGYLRDNYTDHKVSFLNTVIIFTTNAGKQLYEGAESENLAQVSRKVILRTLQKDINPVTNIPYFPSALCSRFASENVVMFNHISANDLRKIAKMEMQKRAEGFEAASGVKVEIEEDVYTALLFEEGAGTDARTVSARAGSFIDDELYELYSLASSERVGSKVKDIRMVKIGTELPDDDNIVSLFRNKETSEILVVSDNNTLDACKQNAEGSLYTFFGAKSIEEADAIFEERDIKAVLLDMSFGIRSTDVLLNIEDAQSDARVIFSHIKEEYPRVQICLLQTEEHIYSEEEIRSFSKQGIFDMISLASSKDGFCNEVCKICDGIHFVRSMTGLARANKLVSYETSQKLNDDKMSAEISLFDFKLETAVDAEDIGNVLSGVSKPDTVFDDIIGGEDAKDELRHFESFLKDPKKYRKKGLENPRGVLLYGPPGTGKTMLAKALAGESDATFIAAEGNQFLKKYSGEGAEAVHELFRTARKYAPSVLFIDEIDAIAKERGSGESQNSNDSILTALLTEMDGFKKDASRPVFVLAATNFSADPDSPRCLDRAFLRRFDRRIKIDLPSKDDRIKFIKKKLGMRVCYELSDEYVENIAVRSTGRSLAELSSIFELAARISVRYNEDKVTESIFDEAYETFFGGDEKKTDDDQLLRIARHEAGHGLICTLSGEIPSYITIVARGDNGGYMQYGDREGKGLYTKNELLSRIRTALGGRAAEIVCYGDSEGLSTGASGDLLEATDLAYKMICYFGMDPSIGLCVLGDTAREDKEVRAAVNKILSEQLSLAVSEIRSNEEKLDRLAELLIKKTHLTRKEISEVVL